MHRIFHLLILLLFLTTGLVAQTEADSLSQSSFRKGRNLVGMTGSIASSYTGRANVSTGNTLLGNLYRFDVRLGKFVADKHMLGLMFLASRTHLIGFINNRAEVMGVGPWYRLYLGKVPNIAFYLQTSLLYSSYFGSTEGVSTFISIDEDLDLQGVRGSLGIGVSYVMGDRVSFDVGWEYNQARYWGVFINNALGISDDIVLDRGEFVFYFGFNILFEKLKRDD